jgi:hypothetical protein
MTKKKRLILEYIGVDRAMHDLTTPEQYAGRILWFRSRGWQFPEIPRWVTGSIRDRALRLVQEAEAEETR